MGTESACVGVMAPTILPEFGQDRARISPNRASAGHPQTDYHGGAPHEDEKEALARCRMVSLSQIGQISINVHDLPRAVAFYRDVLGMKHLFDAGPRLSFFDCGGVRLMLGPADTPELDHPGS